jgi:CubicO group peptidase (beta-lactamase class C family)
VTGTASTTPRRWTALALSALLLVVVGTATDSAGATAAVTPHTRERSVDPALAAELRQITREARDTYHLGAVIVRVTKNGKNVYTAALGESMTGVPATTDMHFRNGAFAFTYIGEIVAQLVDDEKMALDDPLAKWMPELPGSDEVTIRNLLNMTSGYADYVYTPELVNGTEADPFRQWTGDELIAAGVSQPIEFEPGTNFGYSHTNYVILGKVLEKALGRSMPEIMDTYIIKPMKLTNTSSNAGTPSVPEPVLHSYSSMRREALQIPATVAFSEDTTFWNPSWTTAQGAVQTTDIYDLTTSMEVVGSGALVSKAMYKAQTDNLLGNFGSTDPSGRCAACQPVTTERSYGLGVLLVGSWIVQSKGYAGSDATAGYLPSSKYAVSVLSNFTSDGYDATGASDNGSRKLFTALAAAVAPDEAAPTL